MEPQTHNFTSSPNGSQIQHPSHAEVVFSCVPLSTSGGLSLRERFTAHRDRTSHERQDYYTRRGNNRAIGRTRHNHRRTENGHVNQQASIPRKSKQCTIRVGLIRSGKNGKLILKMNSTVEVTVHSKDSVETLFKKCVKQIYGVEKSVPLRNFFVYCQNRAEKSLQYRTVMSLSDITMESNLDMICSAVKKEYCRICFRILEEKDTGASTNETIAVGSPVDHISNHSTDNSVEYFPTEDRPGSSSSTAPVAVHAEINNPRSSDSSIPHAPSSLNTTLPETIINSDGLANFPVNAQEVYNAGASGDSSILERDVEDTDHSRFDILPIAYEETGQQIIEEWRWKTTHTEYIYLDIHRKRLISSLNNNFELKDFSFYKQPVVKFFNETGQDGGGLRRELFSLLMEHLGTKSPLFEKSKRFCFLSNNVELDEKNAYFDAGRLVAWSVLHGGRGLNVMSPECISFMRNEKPNMMKWIKALPDGQLQCAIIKLQTSDEHNWLDAIRDAAVVLEDNGFPGILSWKYENKLEYINSVILNHFFYRNSNAYKNFKAGMNTLGNLWDVIEAFPISQINILGDAGDKLTADALINLINYNYSEPGVLDHFDREEETAFTFHMYLRGLEGVEDDVDDDEIDENAPGRKINHVTLSKLLFWLTGSDQIPVFGFKEKIDVVWFEREDTKHFPQASTCGFKLHLPRGEANLGKFGPYMNDAVKLSFGYFGIS